MRDPCTRSASSFSSGASSSGNSSGGYWPSACNSATISTPLASACAKPVFCAWAYPRLRACSRRRTLARVAITSRTTSAVRSWLPSLTTTYVQSFVWSGTGSRAKTVRRVPAAWYAGITTKIFLSPGTERFESLALNSREAEGGRNLVDELTNHPVDLGLLPPREDVHDQAHQPAGMVGEGDPIELEESPEFQKQQQAATDRSISRAQFP